MTIRTGDTNVATDSTLFPTNQWNAAVLTQTRVLNTLTGRTLRRAKTAFVLRSPTRRCVFRALLPDSFSRYWVSSGYPAPSRHVTVALPPDLGLPPEKTKIAESTCAAAQGGGI